MPADIGFISGKNVEGLYSGISKGFLQRQHLHNSNHSVEIFIHLTKHERLLVDNLSLRDVKQSP